MVIYTDTEMIVPKENVFQKEKDFDSQTEKLMISKGDRLGSGGMRRGCGMEIL